jgi:hypothetical protein
MSQEERLTPFPGSTIREICGVARTNGDAGLGDDGPGGGNVQLHDPNPSTTAGIFRPVAIDPRPTTNDHRPSTNDPRPTTIDYRPSTVDRRFL